MAIVLGDNSYGKAETRLVKVRRGGAEHELIDLNVSVALAGDLAATHETGDNSNVLPTDTQKNTVYAFARSHGVDQIEDFGLAWPAILSTRNRPFRPLECPLRSTAGGGWIRTSFVRTGEGVRTATVSYDGTTAWVVSGVIDLVLLNTTDSEFTGSSGTSTTLPEASDRILATAVQASAPQRRSRRLGQSYQDCLTALVGGFRRHVQPLAAADVAGDGSGGPRRPDSVAEDIRCPCPTGTISWSTWDRSAWTIPARSTTRPIARTA